ncbi:hypothetical protein [Yersinia mollaretii]|uniref:hypothetical protein n=1 Tax=Yersinia mollaretii TaxID=33060 RepID=UPI002FDE1775
MIKANNKWYYIGIAFIFMILGGGVYYMYIKQYQMAVFVTPDSESDVEWPNKHKWFDASEWLEKEQYIKIDNFYLLNTKYVPIENLNIFGITRRLQAAIKNSVSFSPEFTELNNMDDIDFYHLMENNLSYEYLRTEFNDETLKPTEDYFLIYFTFKGVKYEVELLRTIYNGKFVFMTYGSVVHKQGFWHLSLNGYSNRDYLVGKGIKEN